MPSPSGDRGPLERLCGDEAELERRLVEARRAAAAAVAAARGEAERMAAGVRGELERDLARLRAEAEADASTAASRAREAAAAAVTSLALRAERNRPQALARLLEIVLGRGAP